MRLLIVQMIRSNGGMEVQRFQVNDTDYEKDDMKYIYFKYVKPWFDTFPQGTILDWNWGWGEIY